VPGRHIRLGSGGQGLTGRCAIRHRAPHKPGVGHHPHARPDPAPTVAFILANGAGR
jgi:hypothetical protein